MNQILGGLHMLNNAKMAPQTIKYLYVLIEPDSHARVQWDRMAWASTYTLQCSMDDEVVHVELYQEWWMKNKGKWC